MTKRKQPIPPEEWQLAVLKKLRSESATPTEAQRAAAVAETGLDDKWVRNWFSRQRVKSRVAPRDDLLGMPLVDREAHSTNLPPKILPAFRQQVSSTNDVPQRPSPTLPPSRVPSARVHPAGNTYPRPLPHSSVRAYAPLPSRSVPNVQNSSQRKEVPGPSMDLSDPFPNNTLPRATLITTYFRDPLADRYPDFSQFFHPLVYQRFRGSGSNAPINGPNLLMQLLINADMDPHAPSHLKGLLDTPDLSANQVDEPSSTSSQPWPIAFSVRLGDLIERS